MPKIYQHSITVPNEAIDSNGHVNNIEYICWMLDAAIAHSNAQGWSSERYTKIGASWVVRSNHIEYILPAFANDEIVIYTWISSLHKIRSLRKYKFVRTHDQSVLVTAETNWVFFDFQRQRPRSVLPEISSAYEIVPEDEEP